MKDIKLIRARKPQFLISSQVHFSFSILIIHCPHENRFITLICGLAWTVPVLAVKGTGQTGMIVHSTEQRKESSGYWGLQMAREEQSLFDLAHSCSLISKGKYI